MIRENAFYVSWDQFHRDTRALALQLMASRPFYGIVAVTRGGLIPAAIIARELDVRVVDTVSIASYYEEKIQSEARIIKYVSPETAAWKGERFLVIDDLADTGATVNMVRSILPKAHFATLYVKPLGRPVVDTFIKEVSQDTWIYFPWDLGLNFQAPIAKTEGF